jgi:hypothetical protein
MRKGRSVVVLVVTSITISLCAACGDRKYLPNVNVELESPYPVKYGMGYDHVMALLGPTSQITASVSLSAFVSPGKGAARRLNMPVSC